MTIKILFAPNHPKPILDAALALKPPGFDLLIHDNGTPDYYRAAAEAEYYMGLTRNIDAKFSKFLIGYKIHEHETRGSCSEEKKWRLAPQLFAYREQPCLSKSRHAHPVLYRQWAATVRMRRRARRLVRALAFIFW